MKTINVLLVSSLVQSASGTSSTTYRLMEHGLSGYKIHHVNTAIFKDASRQDVFTSRYRSIWKNEVFRTTRIIFSCLWHYAITRPQILHIFCMPRSNRKLDVFRDWLCIILARLFRIKVIAHYHRDISPIYDPRHNTAKFGHIVSRLTTSIIRTSTISLALNASSLHVLLHLTRSDQHTPRILPNFIQNSVFLIQVVRTVDPTRRIKILYAGRIESKKGCIRFLSVARQLPEADFILLGPVLGNMIPYLKTLPNNVILKDSVALDVVLQEMASSDLFLYLTLHYEGMPNAVLEAMAMGLPVIATRMGAIPEMIDHNRGGFLVNGHDEREIIKALRTLISDPDKRSRMGLYNRRKCEAEFRASVVIDKFISIYQQILQ